MNKPLKYPPCNPHGYWLAGHVFLFVLNTKNTQMNDEDWRVVA